MKFPKLIKTEVLPEFWPDNRPLDFTKEHYLTTNLMLMLLEETFWLDIDQHILQFRY